MALFFLVFVIFPVVTPLFFNYSSFDSNSYEIRCEGNASIIDDDGIQLTPNLNATTGHATHVEPLHLWDKSSGRLSDFTTYFTYSIDSANNDKHGDGFALFFAPLTYHMPPVIGDGAGLGLVSGGQKFNSSDNPFFGIEFDTFHNPWDQENDHVGIDISSIRSVKSETWFSSPLDGRVMNASVTYNATAKNLTILFAGFLENVTIQHQLYYEIDLRDYLPEWVVVGFSGGTGADSEAHFIHSWYFSSKLQSVVPAVPPPLLPLPPPPTNVGPPVPQQYDYSTIGVILGYCVVVVVVVLIGQCIFKLIKRRIQKKKAAKDRSMDADFEKSAGAKKIAYSELLSATDNFSASRKLGEGGFGSVYRGSLNGMDVAVKRSSKNYRQGLKEYVSEVKIISQLSHRNLVRLIGWCHENGELLLVYEFIPNGTLESYLFADGGEARFLTWQNRYRICKETANGIHYLHNLYGKCVLHRDIKSANVILGNELEAKLADFGLARLVDHKKGAKTTDLAFTLGYLAPECATTGKATIPSDIYSFGVLALEIATGRRPIEQSVHIVKYVWELYEKGSLLEAADSRLQRNFDEEEMRRMMLVGIWCGHPDSGSRPSIEKALAVLNKGAPPPILPLVMPQVQSAPPPRSIRSVIFSYVSPRGRGQTSKNPRQDESIEFATTSSAYLVPNNRQTI